MLNRPQPSATVRNRSREVAMAMPIVSSAKGVTFGHFQRHVASFRVAGVALRGIPTCFTTRQKVVLCGRRNTFATFSEDVLHVSWQAQHFADLRCNLAWQTQHLRRVVLRGFCESLCQGCAGVVPRCIFRGRCGILWHLMKTDGSLARNDDFEVSPKENRWENVDFDAAKCEI